MRLWTTSQVVDLAGRLGEASAEFYADLAEMHTPHRDLLRNYARQDRASTRQIGEAYRYAVSDALETGFSFDLEEDDYTIDGVADESVCPIDRIGQAMQLEETIVRFLRTAACQSEGLMADIPALFRRLADKRAKRLAELAKIESTP